MKSYDLALVLRTSLSETQRKKFLETIKGWLKPASLEGGDIKFTKEEEWGQKVLSYPIKKETSGYYILLSMESNNVIPSDLEKKILNHENVLRHLLIRKK